MLRRSLRAAHKVDLVDKVLDRLSELADEYPKLVVDCVCLLTSGDFEPWDIEYWNSKAFKVLSQGLKADKQHTKIFVAQAANNLGRRGYLAFRDLYTEAVTD